MSVDEREAGAPSHRDRLGAALPQALMPVGAALRYPPEFGEDDPLTGYGALIVDRLLPVVEDIAEERALVERQRTLADARAVVEREAAAYPGASPAITSGIWGGFDQWAVSEYTRLADPDRRLCGQCGQRHTQDEYDDAHRNDEGGW